MAAENQRLGLLEVRSKMMAALDKKFKNDLDWQAFRALDDLVVNSAATTNGTVNGHVARRESVAPQQRRGGRRKGTSGATVGDLGCNAINEAGRPVPTDAMVIYIGARRDLNKDPKRARINVQSAMSHEERLESVRWRGGSAWWIKGRELPKED